ncbi:MAG: DMT family transporter [Chloroflexi bacterium]|nr:DMT family transporter [Chloroflexota bacterium]
MQQPVQAFPRNAFIALIVGAITIGFSPILVRLSEAGPTATAFWRVAFAVPLLVTGSVLHNKQRVVQKRPFTRKDLILFLLVGSFFAADLTLWHFAIEFTTVANATLLPNFFPVFVTLGSWLLFRHRITRLFLAGMALALLGATLLIGTSASISQQTLLGDVLALSTAVVYAGYFLTISRLRQQFSAPVVLAGSSIVSGVLLLAEALIFGESLFNISWQGWVVLLTLALVAQVLGQGLIAYALAHLQPAFSAVTMILQPLVATILAWLLLSEALSPLQAIGGGIVLAGIYIARRGTSKT